MNSQSNGAPRTATGLPLVGFGTYLIANEDVPAAVSAAVEAGYRHVDTAAAYRNEAGVGAGVRRGLSAAGLDRADLFVTTKLWPGNPAWGDPPKGYDETVSAFEASLAALGLDYVDLYLIHAPSGGSERLNEWRALVDLKARGRARAIGVSNYTEAHIEEIRAAGPPMPEYNQIELHPWSQKPGLLGFMAENNIAPIAYSRRHGADRSDGSRRRRRLGDGRSTLHGLNASGAPAPSSRRVADAQLDEPALHRVVRPDHHDEPAFLVLRDRALWDRHAFERFHEPAADGHVLAGQELAVRVRELGPGGDGPAARGGLEVPPHERPGLGVRLAAGQDQRELELGDLLFLRLHALAPPQELVVDLLADKAQCVDRIEPNHLGHRLGLGRVAKPEEQQQQRRAAADRYRGARRLGESRRSPRAAGTAARERRQRAADQAASRPRCLATCVAIASISGGDRQS